MKNALIFLLCALSINIKSAHENDIFFWMQRGTLPIILTASHGGTGDIPGIPIRSSGTLISDLKTLELTEMINDAFYSLLRKRPYVVAARFHRKYIDVNRPASQAYEKNNQAAQLYQTYHHNIRTFINEIRQLFPQQALLLDIHGQSTSSSTIYRGTKNGQTVAKLIRTYGYQALNDPHGIFGFLSMLGYSIFPSPNSLPIRSTEHPSYNGGYTVRQYGSHRADGIDAIQLEFGMNMRYATQRRLQCAQDIAMALLHYYYFINQCNLNTTVAPGRDFFLWPSNQSAGANAYPIETMQNHYATRIIRELLEISPYLVIMILMNYRAFYQNINEF